MEPAQTPLQDYGASIAPEIGDALTAEIATDLFGASRKPHLTFYGLALPWCYKPQFYEVVKTPATNPAVAKAIKQDVVAAEEEKPTS